jgi:hypothetical protein
LQRAATANRDESGVAIFGKDHNFAYLSLHLPNGLAHLPPRYAGRQKQDSAEFRGFRAAVPVPKAVRCSRCWAALTLLAPSVLVRCH